MLKKYPLYMLRVLSLIVTTIIVIAFFILGANFSYDFFENSSKNNSEYEKEIEEIKYPKGFVFSDIVTKLDSVRGLVVSGIIKNESEYDWSDFIFKLFIYKNSLEIEGCREPQFLFYKIKKGESKRFQMDCKYIHGENIPESVRFGLQVVKASRIMIP